ncbi:hypothetical protein [Microbispora rosea]|uniref:hypothetical protein n=1 Tax=Microbispora rosea TaxID=58117 RepID=UPI003798FD00
MIRRILTRWAERHGEDIRDPFDIPDWPETDQPATPYTLQVDPRDAELADLRRQLAEAQDQITELKKDAVDLVATINHRTNERDGVANELERTKARLAATHLAQKAETDGGRRYTERSVEAPPPPTSDRAEALRERARADALATRLAAVEEELHAIRFPRVKPAKATTQAAS